MQTMTEEQREKLQQPEKPKPTFGISHCKHADDYSLGIAFEDLTTELHTYPWSHKIGYHAEVSIYGLTIQNIKDLASAIMAEAIKIELEQAK